MGRIPLLRKDVKMKTIWKFPLEMVEEQTISMPSGTQILCVQTQRELICLWGVIENHNANDEKRVIRIIGTGHLIPTYEKLTYLGTVQLTFGNLVFHVFEKVAPSPLSL
jgi:hypothetical protein